MKDFLFDVSLQEWFMMKACWIQKYQLMGYAVNFLSIETEISKFIKMLHFVLQNNAEVFVAMYVYAAFHNKWNTFGGHLYGTSTGMHGALPGNRWWASRELVDQD